MLSSRAAMIGKDNPLPAAPSGIAFVDSVIGPVTNNTSQWTHTIASGTNCLLVGVFCNDLANGPTALSIDSGGPFRVLQTIEYASFGQVHYTLYGLLNPPIGTRTLTTNAFCYSIQGVSAAYSGVSGFAATHASVIGTGTNISFGLPAFPKGVAVSFVSTGWSSLTQTSRSTNVTNQHGWQESTDNSGDTRSFSTTWAASGARGAVGVVLK